MNRRDFVLIVDVQDGNPNGDPSANNHPRVDMHTGEGLISDACVKRKIRDYVRAKYGDQPGMEIYQNRDGRLLNDLHRECGAPKIGKDGEGGAGNAKNRAAILKAQAALCARFWDVRVFGAMASTEYNAGRPRGAVQITFGRSLHPIQVTSHQLTRVALTNEKDADKASTMSGRAGKHLIRYAVYRFQGTIMPYQAKITGVSERDIEILIEAMTKCWGEDMSAARGVMSGRALILCQHETQDGNAPMGTVLDAVKVSLAQDVPTSWSDVQIDTTAMPPGVTVVRKS